MLCMGHTLGFQSLDDPATFASDFYKENFERNSFDDQGSPIINLFCQPETQKHT